MRFNVSCSANGQVSGKTCFVPVQAMKNGRNSSTGGSHTEYFTSPSRRHYISKAHTYRTWAVCRTNVIIPLSQQYVPRAGLHQAEDGFRQHDMDGEESGHCKMHYEMRASSRNAGRMKCDLAIQYRAIYLKLVRRRSTKNTVQAPLQERGPKRRPGRNTFIRKQLELEGDLLKAEDMQGLFCSWLHKDERQSSRGVAVPLPNTCHSMEDATP